MRFLLIDKITAWEPGVEGRAVKNIALSEDFFDDHFPLKPIMPGALIVEGMAQLAGLLIEEGVRRDTGRKLKALMSIIKEAKFRHPAYPGDRLEYRARVVSMNEMGGMADVDAYVGERLIAECRLVFSLHTHEVPGLEAKRSAILAFWLKDIQTDAGR